MNGAPPTWVLLRGLAREPGHWDAFPERLLHALPHGARVLALALPGSGDAGAQPVPARVEGVVAAVRTTLHARGVDGPVWLLGLSFGGMVAAAWARAAPAEVQGAVLVNASLGGWPWQRMRPQAWLPLLGIATARDAVAAEAAVLALTSAARAGDRALAERWAALRRARPMPVATVLRQLAAAARCRLPHAPPPVPLLVAASAADRLVDAACSRRIAARWGCALVENASAGHDLPLDAPDWLAERVAGWQRQVVASRARAPEPS